MNYVEQALDVGPDEVVEVTLDAPAFARLLDEPNWENFRAGREAHYQGGWAASTTYLIEPTHPGRWHLVVDLGGNPGRVRSWVRLLPSESVMSQS